MGVYRGADVFRRRSILEREDHFGDELGDVRADQVRAEDLVGFRVGDELHEPRRLTHRTCAAIRGKRKFSGAIFSATLFDLSLGETDGRDLRPRVHDAGNRFVMHVHFLPGDHFGGDHALFFGLVCEHWPRHAVADRIHVRKVRAHLIVDENLTALADIQSERLRVDAAGHGATPYRDEHVVPFDAFGFAFLLDLDEDAGLVSSAVCHTRAGANVEALFLQDLVGFLDDVVVHAGKNRRQQLDHRHLRAESLPDGPELEADHAAADDDEMFRNFGNRERADVRQHALLVEFQERELDWYGAGRNDDVLCLKPTYIFSGGAPRDRLLVRHADDVARFERPEALRPRDLVLSEQELDAFRVLADDVVFSLEHRRQIERQLADADAVRGRRVLSKLVMLGRREQRLRRNTSDVDASASERFVIFDADRAEPELRGANRGDVTAGTSADHDDVGRRGGRGRRGRSRGTHD
jgi:hypothetical protein